MVKKTYENILTALKYYIPTRFWNLNNWDIIIKREEEVEENVFEYRCSFYTLYFNEKLEPIEYGRQHIINDKVYYDNSTGDVPPLAYFYLGKINWYEMREWGEY